MERKKMGTILKTKDLTKKYDNKVVVDNLNIDDFLDNNTPNLYSVSGDDLYKRGAQAAASASSVLRENCCFSNDEKTETAVS